MGLKKNTYPAVVVSYLLHFWSQCIQPHFEAEETLLLPEMKAAHPVMLRLQEEHKGLRDIVDSFRKGAQVERLTETLIVVA